MNPVWLTYLRNFNAVIENNRVLHFGDIAAERKCTQTGIVMADLSHHGLIRFSGDDAQTFLQSQLSCDIRNINLHQAQYGSYCTPKGRVLACFLLWQQGGDYLMELPINLIASIQKRLALYVLRAKVQLTDASNDFVRIGIAGTDSAILIEEITRLPSRSDRPSLHVMHNENLTILCLTPTRMELLTSIENAPALWGQLNQRAKPVGADCWDWLDIQSGIPVILPQTQEEFLPQMINLDALDGISFKKGCYPGQEIVSRTQYLGKLKRRMFPAHIATTETIKAGDALYSADMGEQSSGNIVSAALSPNGGVDVLAVIQQSSIDASTIHWQSLQGPRLEIKSLPYPLPASQ